MFSVVIPAGSVLSRSYIDVRSDELFIVGIRKGWREVLETGTGLNWPVHEDEKNRS